MKPVCQWCLRKLNNSPDYYKKHGNMCITCEERVSKVNNGRISKQNADSQLFALRKINESKHEG